MALLLGIDPGEKKSAIALSKCAEGSPADAELILSNRIPNQQLGEFIERLYVQELINPTDAPTIQIIYEEYLIYPSKLQAHIYSRVNTKEAIGIIEYTARKGKIPLHKCRAVDWKQAETESFRQRYNFWPSMNSVDNSHIRDAAGINLYGFRHRGIFNQGKRVMTWLDKEILSS